MQHEPRRKIVELLAVIFIAALYGSLLLRLGSVTGNAFMDGVVGVLLGLFVCSRPAANAIDLLFYRRYYLRELTSGWTGLGWLALNMLALLLGWLMIANGATRLAARVR